MTSAVIYHNPRCSKSREALRLLQAENLDIKEVLYLQTPPTIEELDELCRLVSLEPQQLIRTKESLFKTLSLSLDDDRTRQEWLKIIVTHPQLLERPLVKINEKAVVARPPERVNALLEGL